MLFFLPFIAVLCVPLAYAHTADYWADYKAGQKDGRAGIFDPRAVHPPNGNFTR